MNDLDRAIIATLRADAEEASVNTKTSEQYDELSVRLDKADRVRTRRHWAVGVTAVLAAAAAVLAFAYAARPTATPPTVPPASGGPTASSAPSASPYAFRSTLLAPNLTASLPAWTPHAHVIGEDVGIIQFEQTDCGTTACPEAGQIKLRMYTPSAFYPTPHGPRVTNPTYAAYLAAWEATVRSGTAVEKDRVSTTVGGRPAVLTTLEFVADAPGLAFCDSQARNASECAYPQAGRTYRAAFVDQGKGKLPTLFTESFNTGSASGEAQVMADVQAWLPTVRFLP